MIGRKKETEVTTTQSVSNPLCAVFVFIDLIMILGTVATLGETISRYEYGTGKPFVISVCDSWVTAKMEEFDSGADFDTTYQAEIEKHLQNAAEMVQGESIWDGGA